MSLVRKLFSNFAANGYAQIVNITVQFVSVPLFIKYWGVQSYGEWLVLAAVPTYFALAEAGFGTVATNELAMAAARKDRVAALRTLHSLWGFLIGLGFVLLVIIAICAFCLPWQSILKISQISPAQAAWSILFLGVTTVLMVIGGVLNAQYRLADRYARGLAGLTTLRLLDLIVTFVVLYSDGGFVALALSLLVIRFMGMLVLFLDVSSLNPDSRLGFQFCEYAEIKRMLKPSLAFMAFPVGNAIYFQGITLAINGTLGASAVVIFNAIRTLTRVISQGVTILKHSTWPEFSALLGRGDFLKARELNRVTFSLSFWVTNLMALILIVIGPWLLSIWTHGNVTVDRVTLSIFLASVVVNGFWFVGSSVLMSVNQHEGLAIRYIITSILGVATTYIFAGRFGVIAAPFGMLLAECVMFPYAARKSCSVLGDNFYSFFQDVVSGKSLFRFIRVGLCRH